jgi:hypothetical protein
MVRQTDVAFANAGQARACAYVAGVHPSAVIPHRQMRPLLTDVVLTVACCVWAWRTAFVTDLCTIRQTVVSNEEFNLPFSPRLINFIRKPYRISMPLAYHLGIGNGSRSSSFAGHKAAAMHRISPIGLAIAADVSCANRFRASDLSGTRLASISVSTSASERFGAPPPASFACGGRGWRPRLLIPSPTPWACIRYRSDSQPPGLSVSGLSAIVGTFPALLDVRGAILIIYSFFGPCSTL